MDRSCKRCGRTRPVTAFGVRVAARDGRHPWCLECARQYESERARRRGVVKREGPQTWVVSGDVATIEIVDRARRRFVVTIDATDVALVGGARWCVAEGYVVKSGPGRTRQMSRILTEAGGPECVDHKNGDPLDNRRSNLRVVPRGANQQNVFWPGREAIRGVTFEPKRGPRAWRARVFVNGMRVHLGLFATKQEAAEAASAGRMRLMPFSNESRRTGQGETSA